jgi:mttA/Hcf106 family.
LGEVSLNLVGAELGSSIKGFKKGVKDEESKEEKEEE